MEWRKLLSWTPQLHRWMRVLLLSASVVAALVAIGLKSDLSKSDWASWVQAIGSIGAILAAFGIANAQTRTVREQVRQESAATDLARYRAIRAVASILFATADQMRNAWESRDAQQVGTRELDHLLDSKRVLESFGVFELPDPDLVVRLLTLPRAVANLHQTWVQAANEAESPGPVGKFSDDRLRFDWAQVMELTNAVGAHCETQIAAIEGSAGSWRVT